MESGLPPKNIGTAQKNERKSIHSQSRQHCAPSHRLMAWIIASFDNWGLHPPFNRLLQLILFNRSPERRQRSWTLLNPFFIGSFSILLARIASHASNYGYLSDSTIYCLRKWAHGRERDKIRWLLPDHDSLGSFVSYAWITASLPLHVPIKELLKSIWLINW